MVTLDPDQLERFVADTFTALGAPVATAEAVGASLVEADLRGHGSHGVMRVPNYVDQVAAGDIDSAALPDVHGVSESAALVDGNRAFGQYVGRVATDELVDRAAGGIGAVGIRNGTHLGRLGEWAERAASHGLLFAGVVSGRTAVVAPPGSAERRFPTNPIAFGVPTFDALEFPVVLDMATSQVAYGKVRERIRTGEPVPTAWTVSPSGGSISDAEAFRDSRGALRPLGGEVAGHKGYGLAVIVELLASFVGDASVIGQKSSGGGNAAAFIAVDPLIFSSKAALHDRLASLTAYLADVESASGVSTGIAATDEVGLFPGEPEHRTAIERTDGGIPLDEGVAATLVEVARDTGTVESLPTGIREATWFEP